MLTPSRRAAPRPPVRLLLGLATALLLAPGHTALVPPLGAEATSTRTVAVEPGGTTSLTDGSSFRDGFGLGSFSVPAAGARPLTVSVQFRDGGPSGGYRSSVRLGPDGSLALQVTRTTGGTETTLASTTLPDEVRAGQRVNVQGWVRGESTVLVRARAWVDTEPKPDWQLRYDDTSAGRSLAPSATRVVASLSRDAAAAAELDLRVLGDREAPRPDTARVPAAAGARLSAAQVGVPSGTSLRRHDGDLVITRPGTVISNLDVHGFIVVRAPDVRIVRSVVRGGVARYNGGLITSLGQPGLVVEDVDLVPEFPSVRTDGILGSHFTLRRVHIRGGVDSVKIQGDDVRVEDSLLEDLDHFDHDPNQDNGPTHNDNVQVLRGRNITITGTTALNPDNFPVLGAAEWGDVTMTVRDNYVDGGHCNMKFAVRNGHRLSATVQGNTFGPHIVQRTCPLVAEKAVSLTASGNVSEVSRRPVVPLRI